MVVSFNPDNRTIKSMFKSYPVMQVPNFQRDYTWEKPYYSVFFKDIINGLIIENTTIKNSEYFIGTMVFSGSEKDEHIEIIDGQQRLTVITILLSVITSKFKDINEHALAEATFEYIKTKDDYGKPIPKLKSSTSYPYFEAFVQSIHKTEISPSSEEEENIKQTYDYFNSELQEKQLMKIERLKNEKYKDLLIAIRDQILMMNVISIMTEDKKSAYDIYEILNAKGKNLVSIELIKNIIFAKFHADENAKDKVLENQWEKIKDILRQRNQNIGMATFFRHFWISKYQKTTHVKLYDSFKKNIKSNKDSYESFVNELVREAENYIKIASPNLSDWNDRKEFQYLVQSLKAIDEIFGVQQARIALLALLDLKSRGLISSKSLKKSINYIENFIFAYSGILKYPANIYESRFSKLAIELRKTENDTDKILEKFLYESFKDKYPQKDEFVSAFSKLKFSKSNNPTNVMTKYVLNKIAINFDKRDVYYNDSSIEHIISEDNSLEKTLYIGNLICLESALNKEADNLNFDEKMVIYKKSKYSQVEKFCENYKDFDLDNIEIRSIKLAEYYYNNILRTFI